MLCMSLQKSLLHFFCDTWSISVAMICYIFLFSELPARLHVPDDSNGQKPMETNMAFTKPVISLDQAWKMGKSPLCPSDIVNFLNGCTCIYFFYLFNLCLTPYSNILHLYDGANIVRGNWAVLAGNQWPSSGCCLIQWSRSLSPMILLWVHVCQQPQYGCVFLPLWNQNIL